MRRVLAAFLLAFALLLCTPAIISSQSGGGSTGTQHSGNPNVKVWVNTPSTAIAVRMTVAATKLGTSGRRTMTFTTRTTVVANPNHLLKVAERGQKRTPNPVVQRHRFISLSRVQNSLLIQAPSVILRLE